MNKPDSPKTAITPTRQENYAEWYQQVVRFGDLAENSPVRGCMVIKPWGYAIWENIQRELDRMFKATGHKNAYFPLFIPKSFLEKEAEHVEGFAKECAVVTHHRLVGGPEGGLIPDPAAKLEEPLVVRPTSETIIGATFANWIQSYRDLPLLINQWANVVRWELRTRLFLRTTEFLWQEGHTAHATMDEACAETMTMLKVYQTFAENFLAIPVICGRKTDSERFPGAIETYCIEAMMQDRKALQAGTSHFLGQNFAKASDIAFQNKEGQREYAWTTSWGVSTRLVGGLIMTHSDDDGLVLPPKIAPAHAVILPIYRDDSTRAKVDEYVDALAKELRAQQFGDRSIEVEIDRRDMRGGDKQWDWVKKGIPLRIEVGPRDVDANALMLARRDRSPKEKASMNRDELVATISTILEEMQQNLFNRAQKFQHENMRVIDNRSEFDAFFTAQNEREIHGGFAMSHWCGNAQCEADIKEALKVTIRCIPLLEKEAESRNLKFFDEGQCIACEKPSVQRVVFAKAY